jgi:hypothetical protein
VFGSIPGNPLAANRPEKVAETERVQREDRKEKSAGDRRKFSKKHSQDEPGDQDAGPAKPEQLGKRIDFEA